MQRTPTSPRPLLVPSPTSSNAPPFIMVSEEELAPYTSTVVSLPPTIPELIQCWEQQHERCAQMARFVERVRVEAAKMAAGPLAAIAAEALAPPGTPVPCTPRDGDNKRGTASNASPPPPQPVTASSSPSSSQLLTAGVVARGVVASVGSAGAPSGTASAESTVVRGTVLTGKVVSATGACAGTAQGATAPLRAAVVATASPAASSPGSPALGNTPAKSSAPPADANYKAGGADSTALISPDELQVLRAKAIGMEAAQQLLASTQDELKRVEHKLARESEKLAKAEDSLSQLRCEVKSTDMNGSATAQNDEQSHSSLFAQMQIALELNEAVLSDTKLKHQSVLYTLAQLTEKTATNAREKAFLEEKNTHLEGQLQRLLMSSMVTGSPRAAAPSRQTNPSTHQAASSSSTAAQGTVASSTATASRLTASESYQKSALEKQVADLQAMTDKLTRDLRKQTARRAKAEETVQALQKELTDLKASALQFRRQINESELEVERAVARKEDEERLRQLERDGNRLRTALRERTEHFLSEKTEWERHKDILDARAKVQDVATRQLLSRLMTFQVKEVVLRQCEYAAALRRGEADTRSSRTSAAATPAKKTASPSKKVDTGVGSTMKHSTSASAGTAAAATAAPPTPSVSNAVLTASLPAAPVGAAADTATLVNRERQLEELKQTFERRIALVDAQRKAEVQQLHALNKELRTALTTLHEELNQKTRMLESAQQQQRQPMALAKFPNLLPKPTPLSHARSSSSMSERRDTAAAWVCRTDGEDALQASMDELSDAAAYSSSQTPVVAAPRQVTDIERRYDPEHMSTWEAVQVENEALLDRLTTMQEEKWKLTSFVEDLQRQSNTLKEELRRNASTMNQLLAAGVLTPAAVSRGSAEGSLRALQCLLQETLQEKFALEEQLRALQT